MLRRDYKHTAKYEGNATTKDLWDEWSAASGKDINKMMSTWTLVKNFHT